MASTSAPSRLARYVAAGIDLALRQPIKTGIFNIGPVREAHPGLRRADIVGALPEGLHHLSVERILSGTKSHHAVDREAPGIVLTGYSSRLLDEGRHNDEARVQSAVRDLCEDRNARRFTAIVLADSMPHIELFDPNLWWYNGPFEKVGGIWSFSIDAQGLGLAGMKLRHRLTTPEAWEVNSRQDRLMAATAEEMGQLAAG